MESRHLGATVEIYTYSNCSSCRNAEALATKHGIDAAKRDLFKDPLSVEELESLFARIGRSVTEMVSTRSRPYRDLGLADRDLSSEELLALMADHPALIRRPIVVIDRESYVGFNREGLEALIEQTDHTKRQPQGASHA